MEDLAAVGLRLRLEWLQANRLPASTDAALSLLLNTDLEECSAGCLPPSVASLHSTTLKGPFLLQISDSVNIAECSSSRTDAAGGVRRARKLALTDGVQQVFAFEQTLFDARAAGGAKLVVRDVCVRHGLLLLTGDNVAYLGGTAPAPAAAAARRRGNAPGPGQLGQPQPSRAATSSAAAPLERPSVIELLGDAEGGEEGAAIVLGEGGGAQQAQQHLLHSTPPAPPPPAAGGSSSGAKSMVSTAGRVPALAAYRSPTTADLDRAVELYVEDAQEEGEEEEVVCLTDEDNIALHSEHPPVAELGEEPKSEPTNSKGSSSLPLAAAAADGALAATESRGDGAADVVERTDIPAMVAAAAASAVSPPPPPQLSALLKRPLADWPSPTMTVRARIISLTSFRRKNRSLDMRMVVGDALLGEGASDADAACAVPVLLQSAYFERALQMTPDAFFSMSKNEADKQQFLQSFQCWEQYWTEFYGTMDVCCIVDAAAVPTSAVPDVRTLADGGAAAPGAPLQSTPTTTGGSAESSSSSPPASGAAASSAQAYPGFTLTVLDLR